MTTKQKAARLQQALELIGQMDRNELNLVVDALKIRRSQLEQVKAASLEVGDIVEFDRGPRRGGLAQGQVTKINRKTIKVLVEDRNGRRVTWTVSPSLAKKV